MTWNINIQVEKREVEIITDWYKVIDTPKFIPGVFMRGVQKISTVDQETNFENFWKKL